MSNEDTTPAAPEAPPSTSGEVQPNHAAAAAAATAYSALEAQVATLTTERDSALERAAAMDALTQDRDTWKTKAEEEASKYTRHRNITAATGTADPEVFELVEYAYGRTPEEGRPDLGDWLNGFKADPSTAPLALRSVFGQAVAAAPPRPNDTPPKSNPPGAPPDVTSEKIKAVRLRAQDSGDWSEYQQLRKLMGVIR